MDRSSESPARGAQPDSAALADSAAWRLEPITSHAQLRERWNACDLLVLESLTSRQFIVGFAASDQAVERSLRLRYNIFTEELGHGAGEARVTGLDRDRFDAQMTHLLLIERQTLELVGTYRLQCVDESLSRQGIYSAQEYDLAPLEPWFADAIECGRACIVPRYRRAGSLLALWGGLREFLRLSGKRWLFGCCSVNSVDPDDGWRVMKELRRRDYLHESLLLAPTPACSCGDPSREHDPVVGEPMPLPKLFGAYMRLGAHAISLPAIDREFGTIDFLVLADAAHVNMSSMGLER